VHAEAAERHGEEAGEGLVLVRLGHE
jgi:hypothetical protein